MGFSYRLCYVWVERYDTLTVFWCIFKLTLDSDGMKNLRFAAECGLRWQGRRLRRCWCGRECRRREQSPPTPSDCCVGVRVRVRQGHRDKLEEMGQWSGHTGGGLVTWNIRTGVSGQCEVENRNSPVQVTSFLQFFWPVEADHKICSVQSYRMNRCL